MITLASDFGTPYPAAMRGVILDRTDGATRIVDVAHGFPRQDIPTAAFWLQELLPWFPPAVHCAVIDPGVGTDRRAIVLRVGEHALVGPDNGLLLPTARRFDGPIDAFEIRGMAPASSTFHGRDVFAPAAAEVDSVGVKTLETLSILTPIAVEDCVDYRLPTPAVDTTTGRATATILAVDDFGNAITNVPGDALGMPGQLVVDGTAVPFVRSFAHVEPGEALVTVGSHGNLELAVNQGRGTDFFDVHTGTSVTIKRRE